MSEAVIAIFDIGKTNKKFLLFNASLRLVHQEEVRFDEITDDDGFACDDVVKLEGWMKSRLEEAVQSGSYDIKALNITTYGASLMYLDKDGKRLTPVYNYLKPMPDEVMTGFYERYGGIEEFSRRTASPPLGMLNSGLQIKWLKQTMPGVFGRVKNILHFPQYLSYLFTGKCVSEYTSIGCHTAMWDFDAHTYHQWLSDEGIQLPQPVANDITYDADVAGTQIKTGIGIHDSSASLVPYFSESDDPFILISTGTWCIFMNPFNNEPLTPHQLKCDSLCYMSIRKQQVKSSRLFMGHIHDIHNEYISLHFGVGNDYYKKLTTTDDKISRLISNRKPMFFRQGVPDGYLDKSVSLSVFSTFDEAYHQFMADLVDVCMDSLSLVIPAGDASKVVYITGGFARNEIFTRLLAGRLQDRKVYISEMDNATALGAAMAVWHKAFGDKKPITDLGLRLIKSI